LEGGLQVIRHTLLHLGFPMQEVRRYTDTVRKENYDALVKAQGEHELLRELLDASELIDIAWRKVPPSSALAGMTLAESAMRTRTGATLVAISRDGNFILNPAMETMFQVDDRLGLLGNPEQIAAVETQLLHQFH